MPNNGKGWATRFHGRVTRNSTTFLARQLSFYHCIERAFGYGGAALEGGFGFIQYLIHPCRRCAQDRLAETIVVTERGYQAMQHKLAHPLIPDGQANN